MCPKFAIIPNLLQLMETKTTESFSRSHLRQTTDHIMMVRPAAFGYNEQTAVSNAFMIRDKEHSAEEIRQMAIDEFDEMVRLIREKGVKITVIEDQISPRTPDAVFPNNWISTHEDGKIVLYPMHAPNRRLERRVDIIDWLASLYPVVEVIDFSEYELDGKYLEGTGSMIFDRVNQIAYANESPRTHPELFELFCQKYGVEGILFKAVDQNGQDIYHTNVMMALGATFAVICLECMPHESEREIVRKRLEETGHEIIEIFYPQVHAFAGNMLQVYNEEKTPFTVMSKRAYDSLTPPQLAAIERHNEVIVAPLDIIEFCGGGSVRCMMAELFHPGG